MSYDDLCESITPAMSMHVWVKIVVRSQIELCTSTRQSLLDTKMASQDCEKNAEFFTSKKAKTNLLEQMKKYQTI